jgi:hypothetical protein
MNHEGTKNTKEEEEKEEKERGYAPTLNFKGFQPRFL